MCRLRQTKRDESEDFCCYRESGEYLPSIVVRKVLVLHSVPVELLAVIVEHTEDIEVEVVGARVITCCEREVDTLSVVIVPNWVAVGIVTQDITATGSNKKASPDADM